MNTERLLKLAEFLETQVPPEQFDMRVWAHYCGTPACAIGWACTIPEFHALGLRLSSPWPSARSLHPVFNHPEGCRITDFAAVEAFFDLKPEAARSLFTRALEKESPREVAQRIREVVRNYQRSVAP